MPSVKKRDASYNGSNSFSNYSLQEILDESNPTSYPHFKQQVPLFSLQSFSIFATSVIGVECTFSAVILFIFQMQRRCKIMEDKSGKTHMPLVQCLTAFTTSFDFISNSAFYASKIRKVTRREAYDAICN